MASPICARNTKPGMSERRALTSFWLVPCEADAARFQRVIDALAGRQSAPQFLPHVSLGSVQGHVKEAGELITLLRGLKLDPVEIDASDSFTMSLILRLKLTSQLQKARDWLEAQPGFTSSRRFDPHISLCYGWPPEREDLASQVDALIQKSVRFNRLVLMQIMTPVKSHEDVAFWKPLATHSFA